MEENCCSNKYGFVVALSLGKLAANRNFFGVMADVLNPKFMNVSNGENNGLGKARRDLLDAKVAFSLELATIVLPLLNRLKELISDVEQSSRLIDLIESNLQHLVRTYQRPSPLTAVYRQLSPIETLVASMIRQGIASKNISEILKLSAGTLNNHRKSIRKKLGFAKKPTNLSKYLKSLPD